MPVRKRTSPTTTDTSTVPPAWPAPYYPTWGQTTDPASPFHVPADALDDYWQLAEDRAFVTRTLAHIGVDDNRATYLRRFAMDHLHMRPQTAAARRPGNTTILDRPKRVPDEAEQVSAAIREAENVYGVNRDGMCVHVIALQRATQNATSRAQATAMRAEQDRHLTCSCCQQIRHTTRIRAVTPASLDPLDQARTRRLCEPCYLTIQHTLATQATDPATIRAFIATL